MVFLGSQIVWLYDGMVGGIARDRTHKARTLRAALSSTTGYARIVVENVDLGFHVTAGRLQELGLVDTLVAEPLGGAHRDPEAAAASLKATLVDQLNMLSALDSDTLLENRYQKIRDFGAL